MFELVWVNKKSATTSSWTNHLFDSAELRLFLKDDTCQNWPTWLSENVNIGHRAGSQGWLKPTYYSDITFALQFIAYQKVLEYFILFIFEGHEHNSVVSCPYEFPSNHCPFSGKKQHLDIMLLPMGVPCDQPQASGTYNPSFLFVIKCMHWFNELEKRNAD